MYEITELTLESPDGLVDCRLEPQDGDEGLVYNATILYPNMVNGYNRSEIYCFNLRRADGADKYVFETGENEIIPKIRKLEGQISEAIMNAVQNTGT